MNIESATTSPSPQVPRAPQAVRQPSTQGTTAESAKNSELTKTSQSTDEQAQKNSPSLSVEDAVKQLAHFVAPNQPQISFSIDDASGKRVVKITDSQTKEVIRQFPSEEAIAIAKALDKLQGLLIKDKA